MSKVSASTNTGSKRIKKTGLGRGLGSLLGEPAVTRPASEPEVSVSPAASAEVKVQADTDKQLKEGFVENNNSENNELSAKKQGQVYQIAIDKIVPNKDQPRKEFEKDALKSLADSIVEKGVIQPILVRRLDSGQFQIIAGERRWRASQIAKKHTVPALVLASDEKETLELALIENIQRKDLNPIEEAEAYQLLVDRFNLTQQQLADRLGKERATVANSIRLLNLNSKVQQLVVGGELSSGLAKLLLGVQEDKVQLRLANQFVKKKVSVRAAEKLVAKYKAEKRGENVQEKSEDPAVGAAANVCEEIQKLLGTKVSLDYSKGKGKLVIQFYSDEELNEVVERIRLGCQKIM